MSMNVTIDLEKAVNYFQQMLPNVADALRRGEAWAMAFCQNYQATQMQQGGGAAIFARELPPAGGWPPGPGGCGCGGKCGGGGNCQSGFCSNGGKPTQFVPPMVPPPSVPMMAQVLNGMGMPPMWKLPSCYEDCSCLDPCLYEYMEHARKDFDDDPWLEYAKQELDFVHLNIPAGGPGYQAGLPLAAGQKVLFRQTYTQQLPYQPGALKIDPKWTGTPVPDQIKVQLWSGERNISGITDPVLFGLVKIGSDFTLQDFDCKRDCWVVPWPKLFNCQRSPIPNRRQVYIEFIAGANLGGATVVSLNPTILKKGSRLYGSYCGTK
jgi:hypothetical protein